MQGVREVASPGPPLLSQIPASALLLLLLLALAVAAFWALPAELNSYDCDCVAHTAYIIYHVALDREVCWAKSRWLAHFYTWWFLTVLRADMYNTGVFQNPDDGFRVSGSAPPATGLISDIIKAWLFRW